MLSPEERRSRLENLLERVRTNRTRERVAASKPGAAPLEEASDEVQLEEPVAAKAPVPLGKPATIEEPVPLDSESDVGLIMKIDQIPTCIGQYSGYANLDRLPIEKSGIKFENRSK